MRLGFGFGFTGGGVGSLASLEAALWGDSTEEYHFTQYSAAGEVEFEAVADTYYLSGSNAVDAARSGTFLLESTALQNDAGNTNLFWVDDSGALAVGPQTTNNIVNYSGTPNIYCGSLGINDAAEIVATSGTAADVEAAFSFIAATVQSNHGVKTMINTLGRDTAGSDAGSNTVREGILNAINNDANILRGIDVYDLDLTDAKHHTQAGQEAKAEREATQIAYYTGNTSNQALGPKITAAEYVVDQVNLTLQHIGGTDITAPSSGAGGMDVTDDGTALGPTSLTRVNATTARLTLAEGEAPVSGSEVKVYVPYGRNGNGLASTSADVMKDNSSLVLPIQSDIITATNGDAIQALDNLAFYFDPRGSVKTYSASTNIQTIDKLAGTIANANRTAAGYEPTYDSTLFTNAGGISTPDASTRLLYTGFTAGNTHSIGMVLKNPASIPGSAVNLLAFSNSSGSTDNQARITMASDGGWYYALNEANGSERISPLYTGGEEILFLFEFNGLSELNVYIGDWSTPAFTIDPRDDFAGWDSMTIGSRSTTDDAALVSYGAYFHTLDILSSSEKTAIEAQLKSRFSIS